MDINLFKENIEAYLNYLKAQERAVSTINQYKRDIYAFSAWLGGG